MLYLLSPCRGSNGYQAVDMMMLAGIPEEFAKTSFYLESFTSQYSAIEQQFPKSFRQTDPRKQKEHFIEVIKLIPDSSIPSVMKLIGCKPGEIFKVGGNRGPTTLYMNCRNAKNRATKTNITNIIIPPPTGMIDILSPSSETSALTDVTNTSEVSTIMELGLCQPPTINRPLFSSSTLSTYDTTISASDLPKLVLDTNHHEKSIEKYFSKKTHRRSAEEAHDIRQWEQAKRDVKISAYKVASTLFETVTSNRNNLQRFESATACATAINQLFGFSNLVSGNQLISAIKEGRVGKSPPRTGNPGAICHADIKDLADLVYTMCSIEQNNAGKRTDRATLVTMIGSIVNQKLKEEGKEVLDTWQFYDRIQKLNSMKQNTCVVDEREARRILWLTMNNARLHYTKWEAFLVKEGFARWPNSFKEKKEQGYVVWLKNMLSRLIIFDELRLSLDGSSDENAGGRQSITHTTSTLNEAGCPANKSGDAVTLMICAIGTEAVAPLIIYPSNAASKTNFKIPIKNIESFQQVRAQYGLPTVRWHDPMFAISKKGGMNKEIFNEFINNHVLPLIPDREDVDGKRVVMKADMGPGRTSIDFLARAFITGSHFFPGMPNSTEVCQEMDQAFGAFKSGVYNNRTALFEARLNAGGLTTSISHADIGYLIFGGKITIPSNELGMPASVLELPNPFEKYLSKEHLESCYKKCGYYPATRAPMRSQKMRHEIIECGLEIDPDSELDVAQEATMQLLEWFETTNHEVVERLTMKGYKLANQGRRYVNRITVEQFNAREAIRTEPNTRERQDALANCKYSGDFFHIDGGVMTSADLLIGKERKSMGRRAIKMQKIKKRYESAASIRQLYDDLIASNKSKWTKKDTVIAIRRHHGTDDPPKGETSMGSLNVKQVKDLYDRKYCNKDVPSICSWTQEMELQLNRLERGEIDSIQETAIYARAVKTNEDYIVGRLKAVSESTRNNAFIRLYETLDKECRDRLILSLQGIETRSFAYDDMEDIDDEEYTFDDDDEEEEEEEFIDISGADLVPIEEVAGDSDTESSESDDSQQPRYGLRKRARILETNRMNDLILKRDKSNFQEQHEKDLKNASIDLEAGLQRISDGKKPLVKQLTALIISKGTNPPTEAKKAALEKLWDELKETTNWKRTVFFTPMDEKELDFIRKKLAK